MDASSLIGQDSYVAGLQKQAAAQTGALKSLGAKAANMKQVHDAAQKFESFFVGQMMEYMSAGLKADKTFGGGQAEETWRSMLNQEYGKEISKSGKLGISDMISKEMIKMQEKRSTAAAAGVDDAAPTAPDADAAAPTATHSAIVAAAGAARYAQTAAL